MSGVNSGDRIKSCWIGMEGYALVDHAEYKSLRKQIQYLKEEIERLKASTKGATER